VYYLLLFKDEILIVKDVNNIFFSIETIIFHSKCINQKSRIWLIWSKDKLSLGVPLLDSCQSKTIALDREHKLLNGSPHWKPKCKMLSDMAARSSAFLLIPGQWNCFPDELQAYCSCTRTLLVSICLLSYGVMWQSLKSFQTLIKCKC